MRVLFTGLTGFLGKNFLSHAVGLELLPLPCDILAEQGKLCDFRYHFTQDELKGNGISDIDVLVHAGAFSPKNLEQMNNIENNLQNITNTDYLLSHLPNKPKKIIYISTISVYDLNSEVEITPETRPYPDSIYGYSKLLSEKIIEQYCLKENIPYQILRLGVMYGNNLAYNGLIPTFIKNILGQKKLTIFGNGQILKNFIDVADVCQYLSQAIRQDMSAYPIMNLVNTKDISINQIVSILEKVSESKIQVHYLPNKTVPPFPHFKTDMLPLCFKVKQKSYEEGLRLSYHFFKEHFNAGL